MADPYYRYAATSDTARAVGGSVPRSSFPGYLSSESSFLAPHQNSGSNDLRSSFPGYLSSESSFLAPHQNSGSNDLRSSFPGYLSSEASFLAPHQNSGSNDPRSSFPGYLSSEAPLLASHHNSGSNDRRGVSSDFVQRDYQMNSLRDGAHGLYDISSARVPSELVRDGLATGASMKGNPPGTRGLDDISGTQVHSEPGLGGVASGASLKEYPLRHGARGLDDISGSQVHSETPLVGLTSGASMKAYPLRPGAHGLDDISGDRIHSEPDVGGSALGPSMKTQPSLEHPNFLSQRQDVGLGSTPGVPDVISERPSSQRIREGLQISEEPNILFVDGLPTDCTRREVGHLFRPFIGFKDIRVVHKEPRRTGDRAMVLCFVEFSDSKCALTALEALQGYKFDDKKPDSPPLRIHFARFPFRLPSDGGEQQIGIRR